MTDLQELAPGALVTPAIRLERLLGRGGMGSVWIAEHLRLRTQVVVKFMAAEYALNQEAMQRFEREATLAAQAKSPHVVQVFDHGVSQFGLPYIAMELLEGEDLAHRIGRVGIIEPALFGNWLSQAARGLTRAHAKGIVHRDIKPENIFLCDNDGEVLVKVLDFGIAKGHSQPGFGTQTGAFLGTAYYMSPEQTMGHKDLDHRSDLWALGVVSFYALTGSRPFDSDSIGALVMAITSGVAPTLSSRNPALGAGLDAWMSKALAQAREQRFQSAKEMAEAFQAALGVVRTSAAPGDPVRVPAAEQRLDSSLTSAGATAARTAPPGLGASTMSPSVRGDAHDPVALPISRRPLGLILGAAAVLLLLGAAAGASHLLRAPDAAASSASAAASASPLVTTGVPASSEPPIATAPPPTQPLQPTLPEPASRTESAASSPLRTPSSKPAKPAAAAPVHAAAPAPAVAVPSPSPAPAAVAAAAAAEKPKPAPAVAPAKPVPPVPTNPLKMKME